jgi:DNA-directed RNA polymerase subunit RPC12/RpoP
MPLTDDFYSHFNEKLSDEILRFADDDVLLHSRYIFTHRIGKKQFAYCTHCRQEFASQLYHNKYTRCLHCGSYCLVKASGRGYSHLYDSGTFTYYEKSLLDPQIVVARHFEVYRDYRRSFRNVNTHFEITAYYVFAMGESVMYKKEYNWREGTSSFQPTATIYGLSIFNSNTQYSRDSLEQSVKGTPFQYSTWEQYDYQDMTAFLGLYSKYPCIEYLTKLGFKKLVIGKLQREPTYSSINWNGKTLFKVLRISKAEFNEIHKRKISVSYQFLRILQLSKQDGSNFTPIEARYFANAYGATYFSEMTKRKEYGSFRTLMKYFRDQRLKNKKHYNTDSSVLTTWCDYISDCQKLAIDLTDKNNVFPRDLYTMHQNTIRQIKIKEDEKLNELIKEKEKEREKFYFEYEGLLIRAAKDSLELIDEGKALHHCVGTYAERYAKGITDILFIRQIEAPEEPYFTIEIRSGEIIQIRGKNNCSATPEVNAFITVFKSKRLRKKGRKVA